MEKSGRSQCAKVNILCLKWGHVYGSEYINRLYAGVKRNLKRPFRFVCVTDDPRGVREEVECRPFPEKPAFLPETCPWPNIFVKLLVFRDGFADLTGPTLFFDIDVTITGELDRFFDYKKGEFCIIHNWIERRKQIFRKRPAIGNSSCFRFEAGKMNQIYGLFAANWQDAMNRRKFTTEQSFMTWAVGQTQKVNWWPEHWVCSFKRQLVPVFPLNWLITPYRPSKDVSFIAFHGEPDIPQAIEGYRRRNNGKKAGIHLASKPAPWIAEFWRE